jgi:general secretion pathway protein C
MVRYLGWLVNTALFVLCCSLVADTANAIIAALLSQTPSAAVESVPVARTQNRSWEERQRIVDRNLFHSSEITSGIAAPVPEDEELDETELPLKLWGTIASDDAALAWASIEELSSRTISAFSVGDQIQRATVVGIERRRVVLLENGNRRALSLDDDAQSPSGRAPKAASSTARSRERPSRRTTSTTAKKSMREQARRLSENLTTGRELGANDNMNNPAALYSQARILPKVNSSGRVEGLEISAIQPGSIFEQVGIQDGEVITRIDGVPISDIGKSAQIMSALTDQGEVSVTLESENGPPRTLPFGAP